ncbi:hypothetical protein [Caulobacter mirabilis]|uniref:TonB C-terminal domain-containing protein n=1 Tax=Caulobacter mirabilis TaxID=69666 RepID=A0A2D2B2U0_9CAUL|nr:hypothetical protein [Caulobacter mirabilis]ATQ44560.1 hypothetical protein CSW64_20290 [Caulobacter mirabilis]
MGAAAPRWRTFAVGLAAALGLGGGAQAQPPAPGEVPAGWIAYAEQVTATVSAWLSEAAEPAVRLRRRLSEAAPAPGQAVSVEVKLWIDADGGVRRVATVAAGDEDMEPDLQALSAGRRFPSPPSGMVQPLRLALDAEPGESSPSPR